MVKILKVENFADFITGDDVDDYVDGVVDDNDNDLFVRWQ